MPILINEVTSEFDSPQSRPIEANNDLSASGINSPDKALRKILDEQQVIISREQRLRVD